jgi:hypothetical protein
MTRPIAPAERLYRYRDGAPSRVESRAPHLVVPCVAAAYRKCGCGATLKTPLDVQLHVCDPYATSRAAMRGHRDERSSAA